MTNNYTTYTYRQTSLENITPALMTLFSQSHNLRKLHLLALAIALFASSSSLSMRGAKVVNSEGDTDLLGQNNNDINNSFDDNSSTTDLQPKDYVIHEFITIKTPKYIINKYILKHWMPTSYTSFGLNIVFAIIITVLSIFIHKERRKKNQPLEDKAKDKTPSKTKS